MRLLVDMNLSPLWIPFFRQQGIEAVHWSELGGVNAPDTEIMDRARAGGFVVFTHDLDFGRLLALWGERRTKCRTSPNTKDVLPTAIGGVVLSALTLARTHLEAGALVTIDLVHHFHHPFECYRFEADWRFVRIG